MPNRLLVDDKLDPLTHAQDGLVTRRQALDAGLTPRAIGHRLDSGQWRLVLPRVYLTHGGEPSRRQELAAALLYAGPDAALDGPDACHFYGLRAVRPDPTSVHVVVPWTNPTRNVWFLVVRRTRAPIMVERSDLLRYVDAATAVVVATRQIRSDRLVLGALSEAVQRRLVTYDDLVRAHIRGSPRHALRTDAALEQLAVGVHSVAENDFRLLVEASPVLPTPLYNCLLRLPGGGHVSPDALFPDAALVHETNGRGAHEREDLFHDMQVRHDAMTAAGLTVLHNPPTRIRTRGRLVVAELERCYERLAGRGLPPGVVILGRCAG
jgi:hypothetical protein